MSTSMLRQFALEQAVKVCGETTTDRVLDAAVRFELFLVSGSTSRPDAQDVDAAGRSRVPPEEGSR